MVEKKTVDMLTTNSVSILTQKYIEVEGTYEQVGQNHRKAYVNSETGRSDLQGSEPEDVVNAVLSIWGDSPTVDEEVVENSVKEKEE